MTGRGRPRKSMSVDESRTKPELKTQVSLPCYHERAFQEEKQHDTKEKQKPRKREPKQPKPTDGNPAARLQRQKCITEKACAGGAKSSEQTPKTLKKQDTSEETEVDGILSTTLRDLRIKKNDTAKSSKQITKTLKKQDTSEEKEVDGILSTTLRNLRIKKNDRAEAAHVINKITRTIMDHLKKDTLCFKDIQEPLRTGSYYENLKIADPDEFDVMMPNPVDRVAIQPFGEDGAFYSVELKRGKSPLNKFQKEGSPLSATEMLKDFRNEVKKCVTKMENVEVTKKKKGCPAVTLLIKERGLADISLDLVPCLMVKSSWPSFTQDGLQIQSWLGTKVRVQYRRLPYYLVPKYVGKGTAECGGVLNKDVWRISFSHVEKAIIRNHGSEKTCCEKDGTRCCRKDCLKLLKHLLKLLKDKDSSFDKFCSYHAKTTLLHSCCSRIKDSDWEASRLSRCFRRLLEDFEHHLTACRLPNFFIPAQNLLSGISQRSCKSLACRIREESDRSFPIFLEK